MKKYIAEFIGTFTLVFIGCGTAMLVGCNAANGCGYILTAFAFGMTIIAMAYSIGNISGCHINPAVSVGMAVSGRMSWKECIQRVNYCGSITNVSGSIPEIRDHVEALPIEIEDKVIHVSASEELMKQLYAEALFFIYPSIYEGFGMPILEAWETRCPVCLSDTSCFPEIAGDAGLYFNPKDIDDMTAKIKLLTEDDNLRQQLISKGCSRVNLFTWQKCANEHYKIYESLV